MKSYALYFAWLIACVSVIGSLFFSEVLHLEPCNLCWYQRISLFPMALLLGLAVYWDDKSIIPYVMPLVVIGFLFAFYQVILQETGYAPFEMCGAGPSCSDKVVIGLGFITLPRLSALALLLMGILLLLARESPMGQENRRSLRDI